MDGEEEERALEFAEELAAACAEVLGDLLVAVILHGSVACGGFTTGRSGVDILVVVGHALSDSELAPRQRVGEPDVRVEPTDIAHLLTLVRREIARHDCGPAEHG